MTASLLTDDQRRHVGTVLRLLQNDIQRLQQDPGLTPDVREGMQKILQSADRLAAAFTLPLPPPESGAREVYLAVLVWAMRVDDLRVRGLRGYGPVHPELESCLHPLLDELQASLEDVVNRTAPSGPQE